MKIISRVDAFLGKYMAFFILGCVALGFTFPDVFSPMNDVAIWIFAFSTFANSLGGGFRDLWRVFHHPGPVLMVLAMLHLLIPLLALGLGNLLFPDAPLFTIGLVLEYAIPTGVATLMWTGMCRGNAPLCLSLVLLDTLCAPFVVPLTMKLLVGSSVEMDALGMVGDLMIMIGIPALLAMTLYQLTDGRVAQTWKPRLSPFAKVGLMLVVLANATGCAPFLRDLTPTLIRVMVVVFLLCLLGFFLGYWAARLTGQDYPTVQTMSLTTGMRNIGAGAMLALAYFPPDVLFPVAFSPVFLQATTAVVVKVFQHTKPGKAFFAPPPETAAENAAK